MQPECFIAQQKNRFRKSHGETIIYLGDSVETTTPRLVAAFGKTSSWGAKWNLIERSFIQKRLPFESMTSQPEVCKTVASFHSFHGISDFVFFSSSRIFHLTSTNLRISSLKIHFRLQLNAKFFQFVVQLSPRWQC